jgi:hypothetical protein
VHKLAVPFLQQLVGNISEAFASEGLSSFQAFALMDEEGMWFKKNEQLRSKD